MKEKGLTLLEILVAMGISMVAGMLLLTIITNSLGLYNQQSSKLEQGLNINDALVQVRNNIKSSSGIASTFSSGGDSYSIGATQLILKIPSIDSSNNIISETYDYYVYYLDSNKFRFKSYPNAQSVRKPQNQILSTLTDSLKFQYFNSANPPVEVTPDTASKVRITLTLKQNTATSEASLRND